MGAGRTELMRAVFGADHRTGGTIRLNGEEVTIRRPADAIAAGIVLLPEDRRNQGLISDFNVWATAILNAALAINGATRASLATSTCVVTSRWAP